VIEERLVGWLREGLEAAAPELGLDRDLPDPDVLEPKQKGHGDFATNVALALASRLGRPPRDVAQAIADGLPPASFVERVEVAGPGFLNIFVTADWLHDALREVIGNGDAYGRAAPNGLRAQVEFVSGNPTGPLTLGTARNAAIGDALARLLGCVGWDVEREYYFNDAGGQMDRFGASVEARYLELLGREADVPEDGYHGAYVQDYAKDILREHGPGLADLEPGERFVRLREEGVRRALEEIRATLEAFRVRFDAWASQHALEEGGDVELAIERLRAAGFIYEAEGAQWFRSTAFGDDKDRVVVRANGQPTYFGADCAYVIDKFERGFDHLLYVWGADHHGDVVRVRGAAEALGYDPDRIEFLIYQWVAFLRGGEPVPMSKRSGNFITLDELIEEVGVDAARFHLLMFSPDHTMNFDIEVVKRQTMDNPVYYVQYGHARISSILRKAAGEGIELRPIDEVDLSQLVHEAETDLLRAMADLPAQLAEAASRRAPHRLTHLAQDLAARFHRFYTECRVVSEDEELTHARLVLCLGAKQVLANVLGLLGVSAPEEMDRVDA
jgi:arginyl-tRNA synthetase